MERLLYRLSKKGFDIKNLKAKSQEYVEGNHITQEKADRIIEFIALQRGVQTEIHNMDHESACNDGSAAHDPGAWAPLTKKQLEAKLKEMEENMRRGRVVLLIKTRRKLQST